MTQTLRQAADDLRFSSIAYSALDDALGQALDELETIPLTVRNARVQRPDVVLCEAVVDEIVAAKVRLAQLIERLAPRVVADAAAQEAEDAEEEAA